MNVLHDDILITPTRDEHGEGIEQLHLTLFGDRGYPPDDFVNAAKIRRQISVFPEGQFAAIDKRTGRVVGHTSSMRVHFDPSHPELHTWAEIADVGWIYKHVPDGEWMYGVDTAVHPDYQGRGIGSCLMRTRFDACKRLNLRGLVGASVIMGYAAVAHEVTPEEYVRQVVAGERFDNNLTKQLKVGFRSLALIPNYVNDDSSLGWGAMIVWENADYAPVSERR